MGNCFSEASNINDKERSTLLHFRLRRFQAGVDLSELPELSAEGEFLKLVSRGKLSHPPADLFDLCIIIHFSSRGTLSVAEKCV